jgi:nucleoside-diphosphate-sugar epimerase
VNILITGASGFIGQALAKEVYKAGHSVTQSIHSQSSKCLDLGKVISVDFSGKFDLDEVLSDIDVVVHTAARVHIMHDMEKDPLSAFLKVNTLGTLQIAKQASEANVKRFIFLSSIGVNGGSNSRPFLEANIANPRDDYSLSKYEAEKGLLEICKKSKMELVIVRPPLVYGPGVKANFSSLINYATRGFPLPFGAVNNKRSLIALENLVSFISCCLAHPKAANETFLISDGEDVSTTELLRKVAAAYGKKLRLFPISTGFMASVAKLVGKKTVSDRVFGTLLIDNSKARGLLGWEPVITMDEQLKRIAKAER